MPLEMIVPALGTLGQTKPGDGQTRDPMSPEARRGLQIQKKGDYRTPEALPILPIDRVATR